MHDKRGVVYVAIGEAAQEEAGRSIHTLMERSALPVAVIENAPEGLDPAQGARWAKANLDQLSHFEETLYIDADTRVRGAVDAGFEILASGFDLVLTPSQGQGDDCLWHLSEPERAATLEETPEPLQLQAGVFWFVKNARTRRLFAAWRAEWLRWKGEDQGALLRALAFAPVKIWLLGRPWNGGAVIEHRYGTIRRAM